MLAERTRQHDGAGTAGLEAEVGGLQRGGVVPDRLRGEADVLLVPELPVAHAVAERGGRVRAERVDGVEVGGEFRQLAGPRGAVVEHARDEDAARAEQVGVVHVVPVVVRAGTRVDLAPAQAVAHVREAGAPEEVAHGAEGVAAVPGTEEAALARHPALRRVDAVEGIVVEGAAFGDGHDGERRILLAALEVVVARRQPGELRRAVRAPRAGFAHGAPAPVGERPGGAGRAAARGRRLLVGEDVPHRVKRDGGGK